MTSIYPVSSMPMPLPAIVLTEETKDAKRYIHVFLEGYTEMGSWEMFEIPASGWLRARNVGQRVLRRYGFQNLNGHALPPFNVIDLHTHGVWHPDAIVPADLSYFWVSIAFGDDMKKLIEAVQCRDVQATRDQLDKVWFGRVVNQHGFYTASQYNDIRHELNHQPLYRMHIFSDAFRLTGFKVPL